MKFSMKQIQEPPFELTLRQDVAMASRNPLECLPAPQNGNKNMENVKTYQQSRILKNSENFQTRPNVSESFFLM